MSATKIASYDAAQRHYLNEFATAFIAKKVVKPGDAVMDLGANEGFHTRTLSSLVGESGKVHAFEPNPKLWPGLYAIPNVRLWPVAVEHQHRRELRASARYEHEPSGLYRGPS